MVGILNDRDLRSAIGSAHKEGKILLPGPAIVLISQNLRYRLP